MRYPSLSFHYNRVGLVELRRAAEVLFEFVNLILADVALGNHGNTQKEGARGNGKGIKQAGLARAIVSDDQGETAVQTLIQLGKPLEIP